MVVVVGGGGQNIMAIIKYSAVGGGHFIMAIIF